MRELNPYAGAQTRQPRGAVLINDVVVPWESFEVSSHSTFDADTFRVTMASSRFGKDLTLAQLLDGRDLRVDVRAGFPVNAQAFSPSELPSIVVGRVDDIEYNPDGRSLVLSGRDFAGLLIDRKTTEKFRNLTSSQIATVVAGRVGLMPQVTDTKTLAGTYYSIDHARLTGSMSEWDLLCWLAHQEGFMVAVKGLTLYFGPKPDPAVEAYTLRWDDSGNAPVANVESLRLSRNLTVAKDVTVTVLSWGMKSKAAVAATYPKSKHKTAAPGTSGADVPDGYVFKAQGLTYEQALQLAQSKHAEITAHEMRLEASMPGDSVLTCFTPMQLVGTGTPFDQAYYPYAIDRSMSFGGGYEMTVMAKNRAPDNQATL